MPYVEVRLEGEEALVLRAENGDLYPCKNPQELWESLMWIADSDESHEAVPAVVDPHAQDAHEERQVIEGEIVTDEELEEERRQQERAAAIQFQNGVPIPDLGDPVSNYAARQAVKATAFSGRVLQNLSFRGRAMRRAAKQNK